MKAALFGLSIVFSITSFAQETIELDSEQVEVRASEAKVIRTNRTPETVEISFLVPMANSVCERYETRYVTHTSGSLCGWDTHVRRIPVGQVCVRTNHSGRCILWQDTFREEVVHFPRTCTLPDTFCAERGTATTFERDTMKVRFKNLPALSDSESETFKISARQKNYNGRNVVYDVRAIKTLRDYKISQKKFLFWKRDAYVVEEK
jgi:hypothetical protein